MQWDLSEVLGYRVHARDGSLGTVTDLYVDDVYWKVRYLVVAGDEQPGTLHFLLATEMISRIDREIGWMSVLLNTDMVHDSPAVTNGRHIPWREESWLRAYYGLPSYCSGLYASRSLVPAHSVGSPRLHSLEELRGYRVRAGDGEEDIGPLMDLVFDDHTWAVHSLAVGASRWCPAGHVWISSHDIKQVHTARKQIALGIPLDAVLNRPKADQPMLLAPGWEPTPQDASHCVSQLHEWSSAT